MVTKQEIEQNAQIGLSAILDNYSNSTAFEAMILQNIMQDIDDPEVRNILSQQTGKYKSFYEELEESEASNSDLVSDVIIGGALGYADQIAKGYKDLTLDIINETRVLTATSQITIEQGIIEYFENIPVKAYYEKTTGYLIQSETVLSETTHVPVGKILTSTVDALGDLAIVSEFKDTFTLAYDASQSPGDIAAVADLVSSYMKTGGAVTAGLWADKLLGGGMIGGVGGGLFSTLVLGAADKAEDAIAQTILAGYNAGTAALDVFDEVKTDVNNAINDFLQASGQDAVVLLDRAKSEYEDYQEAFSELVDDLEYLRDNPGDVFNELPPWMQKVLGPLASALGISGGVGSGGGGDPLVIDLDRDGDIELTSLQNGVYFDLWSDGHAKQMAWVAPDDGLLAFDKNHDGFIDGVNELFGSGEPLTFAGQSAVLREEGTNGFAILDDYDSNNDGVINASDNVWGELSVWQDVNQNGVSDAGELLTMAQAGVQSIDVKNYDVDQFVGILAGGFARQIEGNIVTHSSSYIATDGTRHEIADVWLDFDLQNTAYNQDYTLDVRTLFLPTLRGYGQIQDLHVAASIDNGANGLLDMLEDFATTYDANNVFSNYDAVRSDVEDMLYDWAGIDTSAIVNSPDFQNAGVFGQMPEYYFIKKFLGQDSEYLGTWIDQTPFMPSAVDGVEAISDAWSAIVDNMMARLVFQSGGAELFDNDASYNVIADQFEGDMTLSQSTVDLLESQALLDSDGESYWNNVAGFIEATKGIDNLTTSEVSMLNNAVIDSLGAGNSWNDIVDTLSDNVTGSLQGGVTYTGTKWNDVISGGNGDDTLIGGDGDDVLNDGSNGYTGTDDILIGGAGNDIYRTFLGADTIQYDYGHDVVRYGGDNLTDTILFGGGIDVNDVKLSIPKESDQTNITTLTLEVEGRGSITIEARGSNNNIYLQYIDLEFEDGTVIDIEDMEQTIYVPEDREFFQTGGFGYKSPDLDIIGSDTDTYINIQTSAGQNAYFVSGSGDDTINGSNGNETILFNGGDKTFYAGGGQNAIELPEGYTLQDVSFYRSGTDAHIRVSGLGELTIQGQMSGSTNHIVQSLKLADGSTIDLMQQEYIATRNEGEIYYHQHSENWTTRNDVYLFEEGQNAVSDNYGTDTILFSEGVELSDLTLNRYEGTVPNIGWNGVHLVIEDGEENSLTVHNHFQSPGSNSYNTSIEKLQFADGSIVNISDLEIEAHGTEGDDQIGGADFGDLSAEDRIYGFGGDDSLNGGNGLDRLYGGNGQDVLNGGEGNDRLYGENNNDTLYGGNGNDYLYGQSGDDTITGGFGNDHIDGGWGNDNVDGGFGNDRLVYRLHQNHTTKNIYSGGNDEDTLRVYLNNADYSVPLYNELQSFKTFIADASTLNQTFEFEYMGLSVDRVEHLEVYVDNILSTASPNHAATAPTAKDDIFYSAKDAVISGNLLSNNGNGKDVDLNGGTLTLTAQTIISSQGASVIVNSDGTFNYTPIAGYVGSDSFDYTLNDNTNRTDIGSVDLNIFDVMSNADIVRDSNYLNGTAYSNGNENHVLISGKGADSAIGYSGDDIFIYNLGDGNDTFVDSGGTDQIQFGAGISVGDVSYRYDNNHLLLDVGGNTIKINNQFSNSSSAIETAVFYDGSTVNLLGDFPIIGTDEAENLYGLANKDDTLIGGKGDDNLGGNSGDDTYVYNLGDGSDTINDNSGNDRILFGAGITQSDVELARGQYTSDLIVRIGSEVITLDNQFQSNFDGIEKLVFSDGSDIDLLDDLTFTGTDEAENLYGLVNKDDTLIGGKGDDILGGNTGDDTYVYNLGDGSDTINESSGNDRILFGAGISLNNIEFAREISTSNLIVRVGVERITLTNQFLSNFDGMEQIVFADGSYFDLSQPLTFTGSQTADTIQGLETGNTFIGLAGDDNLSGRSGNDTYIGGFGDDTISDTAGDDTYIFNLGDGHDHISDYGGNDTIQFGAGMIESDMMQAQQLSNLVITFAGNSEDSITIFRYFYNNADANKIENFEFFSWNTITGTSSNNSLSGTVGADYILGLAGNDTINAKNGDDLIEAGDGDDTAVGGLGDDEIHGDGGVDILRGGVGNDLIYGGDDDDTIRGDEGMDVIHGGLGDDLIYGDSTYQNVGGVSDEIHGGAGDDTIYGGVGGDVLYGDAGADYIDGANDDDYIEGGDGDDTLRGERGHDTIHGDAGNDTINGNRGNDYLYGGAGNDTIEGGEGHDRIYGGDGDDTLKGDDGNDILYGQAGEDTLRGHGDQDVLFGGDDDDQLEGYAGNDLMIGGGGVDTHYGYSGQDKFYFDADAFDGSVDKIMDFSLSDYEKIVVTEDVLIGYDETTSAIADFIQMTTSGNHTNIMVDRDGEGTAYNAEQVAILYNANGLSYGNNIRIEDELNV